VNNGDAPHPACDVWHRFEQDVDLIKDFGYNAHRFSIEWARIEPSPGRFDDDAIERYRRMLGALRDASIAPMVTLLHFSLPQWIANQGGFLNPSFASLFERFVNRSVERLGDLVDRWVTINEPNVTAALGYFVGIFPPGHRRPWQAWRAQEAMLDAHARAYRAIHERAGRCGWNAEVGVAHHLRVVEPWDSSSPTDRWASDLFEQTFNRAFLNALCGLELSRAERSMLALTRTKRRDVRDTHDFFGLNYYGRFKVRVGRNGTYGIPIKLEASPGAEISDVGWEVYPEGLGRFLREWSERCGRPVYVTENGIADSRDAQRASFLVRHLAQVADAMQDGVDVRGYFHWSLLDNFEWTEGYEPRYGLVEMQADTLNRCPRPSAAVYGQIASKKEIDDGLWEQYGTVPERAWRAGGV
jgi:beta-glucosidase